jgi:hypothetical protein
MFSVQNASKQKMLQNYRKCEKDGISINDIFEIEEEKRTLLKDRAISSDSFDSTLYCSGRGSSSYGRNRNISNSFDYFGSEDDLDDEKLKYIKLKCDKKSLKIYMKNKDALGWSCRKIAEVASKYNLERNGILLETFKTRSLDFFNFKIMLKKVFNLEFTDEEFERVCSLFDADGGKTIDGEGFRKCITLLATLWKEKLSQSYRKLDNKYKEKLKEQEELRQAAIDSKYENAADYSYSDLQKKKAEGKLKIASKLFIKNHPSSMGLDGFDVKFLMPIEFRELLKRTFNILVDKYELGALVRCFDTNDNGVVDCATFLIKFARMGKQQRDDLNTKQLIRSRKHDLDRKLHHEKIIEAQEAKLDIIVDKDSISDEDRELTFEKLKISATKYRREHPSSMGLDGFEGNYLSPGAFREILKRTFNLFVNEKELAVLVEKFDEDNINKISCHLFLLYFLKIGKIERYKANTAQLLKQRKEIAHSKAEQERLLLEQWKKMELNAEQLQNYSEQDEITAFQKLRVAARLYDQNATIGGGALKSFETSTISPAVFREMCNRCLNVKLTIQELAALVAVFQEIPAKSSNKDDDDEDLVLNNDHEIKISCEKFVLRFKTLSNIEKDAARANNRIRHLNALRMLKKHNDKLEADKIKNIEGGSVDFDFSDNDSINGFKKMKEGASRYNKNHPSCVGLDALQCSEMSPGNLKDVIKKTFQIELTPTEFGSVVSPLLLDNGKVNITNFMLKFFELSREYHNERRKRLIEAEKKVRDKIINNEIIATNAVVNEASQRLIHDDNDAITLLEKLKKVSKLYALDSAAYVTSIQCFKGPPNSAPSFRDSFYRIFLVRLSFGELGVLAGILNPKLAESNLIDGSSFLTSFYRLARVQERVLLGEIHDDEITLDIFKLETNVLPPSSLNKDLSPVKVHTASPRKYDNNENEINFKKNNFLKQFIGDNPWIDRNLKEAVYLKTFNNKKNDLSKSEILPTTDSYADNSIIDSKTSSRISTANGKSRGGKRNKRTNPFLRTSLPLAFSSKGLQRRNLKSSHSSRSQIKPVIIYNSLEENH